MFQSLEIFQMSHAMATHAGRKQALISQNIANADTPGYAARDLPAFASLYESQTGGGVQRASRAGHLHGVLPGQSMGGPIESRGETAPDGNSVSIEQQMLKASEVQRQHSRALAIYKSSLNILHSALARA